MLTGSQGKTNILVFDLNFHLKNDKKVLKRSPILPTANLCWFETCSVNLIFCIEEL